MHLLDPLASLAADYNCAECHRPAELLTTGTRTPRLRIDHLTTCSWTTGRTHQ